MKTGQDVVESGLYCTECCNIEVELLKDAMFPRCPRCMGLVAWELIETLEEQAA